MLCVPGVSAAVENVTDPFVSEIVVNTVPPSVNVTVPLGVPPEPATVTKNCTECPATTGFVDDAITHSVGFLVIRICVV